MPGDVIPPGQNLEAQVSRHVPGDRVQEVAARYPDDAEVQRLAARAEATSQVAVLALVTAWRGFEELRDTVVARISQEPLNIREASVGDQESPEPRGE